MTLGDLRDSGYHYFTDPKTRPEYIRRLELLFQMASGTNLPVEKMTIDSFIAVENGHWVVLPTKELLKNFKEWRVAYKLKPRDIKNLATSSIAKLKSNILHYQGGQRESIERIINQRDAVIKAKYREIERERRDIFDALISLKDGSFIKDWDLVGQLKGLFNDGWWLFNKCIWNNDYCSDYVEMITPEIYLEEVNPVAGINLRVYMGRYLVRFYPYLFSCSVHRYSDNLKTRRGYIHPFLLEGQTGGVCFGTAEPTARQLSGELDVYGYLNLVRDVLTNYQGGNPYEHLQAFAEEREKIQKARADAMAQAEEYAKQRSEPAQEQSQSPEDGAFDEAEDHGGDYGEDYEGHEEYSVNIAPNAESDLIAPSGVSLTLENALADGRSVFSYSTQLNQPSGRRGYSLWNVDYDHASNLINDAQALMTNPMLIPQEPVSQEGNNQEVQGVER